MKLGTAARRGLLLGSLALALVASMVIWGVPSTHIALGASSAPHATTAGTTSAPAAAAPDAAQVPSLSLGISAVPKAVCAYDGTGCPAGVGMSRVTMTAQASPNGLETWPNVQVAFVIETTAYDGVYDPTASDPGRDECAASTGIVCEESNGVPFYVAHAQQIADAIQAANPHSQVSFAMVDYFATLTEPFDDGDGSEYHVDIPQFVPASEFGASVQGSFQATVLGGGYVYSDSDLSDNILDSSSITALYGTILGSGLDWSPNTHHVIVWMGSTVPRDPNYEVNYLVSASDWWDSCGPTTPCYSSGCEPSYTFGALSSPNCEGWVRSQDGNITHSIAELAKTSPTCTDSIGGECTVDTIDLYNGVTDPWSKQWPAASAQQGGGPGGIVAQQDSAKILLAGCDLAAATGGTWAGPNFFTCPSGQQGSLAYMQFGTNTNPNTANPTLLEAFRDIGFGPVTTTLVANGTKHPIFQFVPYGNVRMAPGNDSQIVTVCTLQNGLFWRGGTGPDEKCPSQPEVFPGPGGVDYYGWNWSNNASQNAMYVGDTWQVSFNIVVQGPPYALIPVDDCTTAQCKQAGSVTLDGLFTSATYLPVTNHTVVTQSFPAAQITVEQSPSPPPSVALPPPAPPPAPGIPIAAPAALPAVVGVGVPAQVGVANAALQATAAGLLAAGFIRITQRNRPLSVAVAALSGKGYRSKFDSIGSGSKDPGIGRFE